MRIRTPALLCFAEFAWIRAGSGQRVCWIASKPSLTSRVETSGGRTGRVPTRADHAVPLPIAAAIGTPTKKMCPTSIARYAALITGMRCTSDGITTSDMHSTARQCGECPGGGGRFDSWPRKCRYDKHFTLAVRTTLRLTGPMANGTFCRLTSLGFPSGPPA